MRLGQRETTTTSEPAEEVLGHLIAAVSILRVVAAINTHRLRTGLVIVPSPVAGIELLVVLVATEEEPRAHKPLLSPPALLPPGMHRDTEATERTVALGTTETTLSQLGEDNRPRAMAELMEGGTAASRDMVLSKGTVRSRDTAPLRLVPRKDSRRRAAIRLREVPLRKEVAEVDIQARAGKVPGACLTLSCR